jgi:hypothetical protein
MPKVRMIVALAAVMLVALSNMALGSNGDPVTAGQNTTASSQTTLTTTVSGSKQGLRVINNGTSTGAAINGINNGPGSGIVGTTGSASSFGVFGRNTTDGTGVYGVSQGSGPGARGQSTGGNGVFGSSASGIASGVYGENTSVGGYGVAGRAGSSGNAIYGDNTGTGFAGYFEDKVYMGGELICTGCVTGSDVSGKVSDADELDGIDSTGFINGVGKAAGQAVAMNPGVHLFLGPPLLGFLRLSYSCPTTLTNSGVLFVYNDSGSVANVFVESGTPNPTYTQMAAGVNMSMPATATGDSYHIQAQGALGVLTIEVATVNRASDCHAQAQALLTG